MPSPCSARCQRHLQAEQWAHYGGDAGGGQYSSLDQIDVNNVGELEVAWQYRSGELERRTEFQNATAKVQVNPILLPDAAGGHLMICTPFNRLIALDPGNGKERWVYDPEIRVGGYASPEDPRALQARRLTTAGALPIARIPARRPVQRAAIAC